jgi:hypothetical protein
MAAVRNCQLTGNGTENGLDLIAEPYQYGDGHDRNEG